MDFPQRTRLLDGYLNHVLGSRSALRWVVLEENQETGHMDLNIYRKSLGTQTEKELRKCYTLTRSNFIGTERGTIRDSGKGSVLYWAIILMEETILFKDKQSTERAQSQFERWNDVIKQLWKHQSWEVTPIEGVLTEEHPKLILHLNSASLCLALMDPPRHFRRWPITNVRHCISNDNRFSFTAIREEHPGFYEVRVTRAKHALKIKSVVDELQRGIQNLLRPVPKPPVRMPSEESAAPEEIFVTLNDLTGGVSNSSKSPVDRSSGLSTVSLKSFNRDSASVTSFDSVVSSTPSPTPPVKPDRNSKPVNPFIFPSDGVNGASNEGSNTRTRQCGSPSVLVVEATPPPLPTTPCPSLPRSRSRDEPSEEYVNIDQLQAGTTVGSWPLRANSPFMNKPSVEHLDRPRTPSSCFDQKSSSSSSSSSPSSSSSSSSLSCDTSTSGSISSTNVSTSGSQMSEHSSQSGEVILCNGTEHNKVPDEGYFEEGYAEVGQYTSSKVDNICLKLTLDQRSHYINIKDGSNAVDLSTEPDEQPTYMNVAPENSLYMNPPLEPITPTRDEVGPMLPPRLHQQPPPVPPRKKNYDLCELLQQAKCDSLVVVNLTSSHQAHRRFCMYFDLKKNQSINDWRALAERVGLTSTEIDLVDNMSRTSRFTATEIVLAYWESNCTDDMPYTLHQLVAELEHLDRRDLIDLVLDRENKGLRGGIGT